MEMKPKNREWVKNAAIILLAGLLVLTFFSNTIMNRNLPEVSTQNVTDGSINVKVRCSGVVAANGNHQVKAGETREIRAVMVKTGQKVEPGDVLFVLGSGDKTELEQAQEQLQQLQNSYSRTALGGSSSDYTADQLRVDAAERAYEEAKQALEAMDPLGNEDSDAYRKLQKDLEKAEARRDAAKEAYDKVVADAGTALADAEAERLSAEQDVILKEQNLQEGSEPLPGQDEAGNEKTLEDYLAEPGETAAYLESLPETDLDRVSKWRDLEQKTAAVDGAKDALNALSSEELDAAQAEVDAIRKEMSQYNSTPAYKEAEKAVEEARLNYLDLKAALDARKQADAKSNATLGIELQDLSRQIEEQKKKIEELSGGEGNQIQANVAGTVQSIECTAGDTVLKDTPLCVIEVPDMGYSLTCSVTNDQATRLKVGDSASITNYYWGSEITATLESIRVDPKNPQTNKLLTFDVSGSVTAGTELSVSVGQRSANYDTVVPKSAIHNDNNGYFVLKIESKSSPLGNRYIARRVSVEILAQDDSSAAVLGDLNWGDYVVVTSGAPIKNGDLVRLSD